MIEKRLGAVELRFAEIIWARAPLSSTELVRICASELDWKKSTTYTVLKKLIDKGYIRRDEPGFICSSLITRGEIQRSEARGLLDRFFSGSRKALFSALLEDEELSEAELAELRDLIDRR